MYQSLVLYSESKEDLKMNADKNKGLMLGGEEGLLCEVNVDERKLQAQF